MSAKGKLNSRGSIQPALEVQIHSNKLYFGPRIWREKRGAISVPCPFLVLSLLGEGKTEPLLGSSWKWQPLPSPWSCQSGGSVYRSRCPCPRPCDVSCQWCRWPARGSHPFHFPGHRLLPWQQKPNSLKQRQEIPPETMIYPKPPLHPPSLVTWGAGCCAQLWTKGINEQITWKMLHAYILDVWLSSLGYQCSVYTARVCC